MSCGLNQSTNSWQQSRGLQGEFFTEKLTWQKGIEEVFDRQVYMFPRALHSSVSLPFPTCCCQLQPIYLFLIKKASSHIRPSVAYGLCWLESKVVLQSLIQMA